MKILHVIPSYVPAYRYGGPIKAIHELCVALTKKGLDITVFTTNMDQESRLDVPLKERVDTEGVKVFYYPVTFMQSYYYSADLSKAIKSRIHEFDIVHIHSVYLHPTFSAAYWCRKRKIPYIMNPLGAIDERSIRPKSHFKKMLYINLIERRNIKNAKTIHAASLYEKEAIRLLGFKTPVAVIPRGLDPAPYAKEPESDWLRRRYPELKNKKIVLFLGRIHPKKGLDKLMPAFKRVAGKMKDAYLVIAGPDENKYASEVKKMARKNNIEKNTIFTGMLLGKEKLSAFHSSDIFVLPSYVENFGVAVLEAMACKLPVVISNRVGLFPDVEKYNAGIVVDCDDIEKLDEAILKLLRDDKLRKSMGENGEKLVGDRFSLDKIAGEMHSLYTKTINEAYDA